MRQRKIIAPSQYIKGEKVDVGGSLRSLMYDYLFYHACHRVTADTFALPDTVKSRQRISNASVLFLPNVKSVL